MSNKYKYTDRIEDDYANHTSESEASEMESRAKKLFDTTTDYAVTGVAQSVAHMQPSHVAGARDPRNVTVIGLYRNGLCTPALAKAHGAKAGDHLEAIRHGVTIEACVAAGVDLQQIKRCEARVTGKGVAQSARIVKAEIAARLKAMVMVRRSNGSSKVIMSGRTPVAGATPHEVAVAMAVAIANRAAKAKKDREYDAKHGVTVRLSAEEQSAMIARNAGKVYFEDK